MAKRKAKSDATVSFNLTLSGRLARRLDAEFAKAEALNPLLFISRSAFLAYCLAEFIAILDDPWREPTPPKPARVRVRPKVGRRLLANGNARLTADKVRAIRKDPRPFQDIARAMGVAATTVGRVKNGQTWAWVT